MKSFCSLCHSLKVRLVRAVWPWQHPRVVRAHRARFVGGQPTILCCNCTAGALYHDLGLQFASPTINLYMSAADFMSFCERLEYYLSLPLEPVEGEENRAYTYPLARLGKLTLHCVHYASFAEVVQKWDARKQRVDWENIFVIATDRDGFDAGLYERFCRLPYRKKLFAHKPWPHLDCVCIAGYESAGQVGDLMQEVWGGTRVIDQFDWVGWLNSASGANAGIDKER